MPNEDRRSTLADRGREQILQNFRIDRLGSTPTAPQVELETWISDETQISLQESSVQHGGMESKSTACGRGLDVRGDDDAVVSFGVEFVQVPEFCAKDHNRFQAREGDFDPCGQFIFQDVTCRENDALFGPGNVDEESSSVAQPLIPTHELQLANPFIGQGILGIEWIVIGVCIWDARRQVGASVLRICPVLPQGLVAKMGMGRRGRDRWGRWARHHEEDSDWYSGVNKGLV